MRADNARAYEDFAPFYAALLVLRSHFKEQIALLERLFRWLKLNQESRILDAACGTGHVLAGLSVLGYDDLAGLDGMALT